MPQAGAWGCHSMIVSAPRLPHESAAASHAVPSHHAGFTVSAAALAAWSADGPMSRICGVAKQAQAEAAPAPMPHVFQPGGVQKPFESAARPPMGPPAGYKRPAAFTA